MVHLLGRLHRKHRLLLADLNSDQLLLARKFHVDRRILRAACEVVNSARLDAEALFVGAEVGGRD